MPDIQKQLGARIKELRKRQHLTQENLAEKIDIGPRSLRKIEAGKSFPSSDTLEKLHIALEVSPMELFNFEHLCSKQNLRDSIIDMIDSNTDRIPDIYKIVKALTS